MDVLETLRARLRDRLAERDAHVVDMENILAIAEEEQRSDLNEDETTRFAELRGAITEANAEISEIEARIQEGDTIVSESTEAREATDAADVVDASHPAVLLKTSVVTIGVHVFSMLSIVCVGRGLGIHASIVDYFLYLPIINSVTAIPITVSGFGVREGMYVAMFNRVGVPGAAALAMSLLGYLATLFWSVVGAGFYLTHRKDIPSAAQIDLEN